MASIFDELFAGGNAPRIYPSVDMDACTFTLVGIEPYHEWVDTGQVKEDGTPKRTQSHELTYDETGERVRVVLSFVLTDEHGMSTSAASPLVDRTHYLDVDTVSALMERRGQSVTLTRPRIELREQGQRDSRWGRIETRMVFAFDGIEV